MSTTPRISVDEAYRKVAAGEARLICAYEDNEKCRQIALPGAIPLTQLEAQAALLPKSQELIFYCA